MPAQVTSSRIVLLGTENADGSVTGVTTGVSQPILRDVDSVISIYLRSIGTLTGGIIGIEESDSGPLEPFYSGTWSALQGISPTLFSGGAQLAIHVVGSAYGSVRVRIVGSLSGGGTLMAVARSCGAA